MLCLELLLQFVYQKPKHTPIVRLPFKRLQVLIDAICLRRSKTDKRPDGSPIVNLLPKTVINRNVELENGERSVYELQDD